MHAGHSLNSHRLGSAHHDPCTVVDLAKQSGQELDRITSEEALAGPAQGLRTTPGGLASRTEADTSRRRSCSPRCRSSFPSGPAGAVRHPLASTKRAGGAWLLITKRSAIECAGDRGICGRRGVRTPGLAHAATISVRPPPLPGHGNSSGCSTAQMSSPNPPASFDDARSRVPNGHETGPTRSRQRSGDRMRGHDLAVLVPRPIDAEVDAAPGTAPLRQSRAAVWRLRNELPQPDTSTTSTLGADEENSVDGEQ